MAGLDEVGLGDVVVGRKEQVELQDERGMPGTEQPRHTLDAVGGVQRFARELPDNVDKVLKDARAVGERGPHQLHVLALRRLRQGERRPFASTRLLLPLACESLCGASSRLCGLGRRLLRAAAARRGPCVLWLRHVRSRRHANETYHAAEAVGDRSLCEALWLNDAEQLSTDAAPVRASLATGGRGEVSRPGQCQFWRDNHGSLREVRA